MPKDLDAIRSKARTEILAKYLPRAAVSNNARSKQQTLPTSSDSRHLSILRPEFQKIIAATIRKAWEPSTSAKYSNGVKHFLNFCDMEQVPHHSRLPASEYLLSAFASRLAGKLSGNTVCSKLAGIRAWHILNGMPWLGGMQLSYVLRGVATMAPPKSRRPTRPPISNTKLLLLSRSLNFNDNLDCAVYFAALAAFWGQIRLGELLSTTEQSYDPRLAPSIGDLGIPNRNGSRKLRLPNTKMGGPKGEEIILCRQRGVLDPISALERHFAINSGGPNDVLCGYRSISGLRIPLTRQKFLLRCNQVWATHNLPSSTGHEFRIGGTHMLLAKIPHDVVKALGRWSSDSFLRY